MSVGPGVRLGAYEILAPLGSGGMGEVYRARDTKLDRDVALKVLPDPFAGDPDRLARFQREAHLLAALNHPHIAQIHGLEDDHGQTALVMELVEGPTLADRIAEGPIPLDEALAIARQVAEALAAAHDHGIIHRDLKPANIKIREDGTVKVLDFGLAKAIEPLGAAGDIVNSPTLTSPSMTRQGVVLGTAAYMAPEQARGRPVDKRVDIWAFGVVLFEMLTARRLFVGADVTDTIAAIVKAQPDLTEVPPQVRRLIARCLEKDPVRRLRDIGDAWDLVDTPVTETGVAPSGRLARLFPYVGLLLAGAALGAIGGAALRGNRDASPAAPVRFVESLPEGRTMPRGVRLGTAVALAPDGAALVYSARENGQSRLYRRFLGQLEFEPIGDVGATEPFFSPDGQWVGYVLGAALRRVSTRGGPAETIAQLPEVPAAVGGVSWNTDGTIVVGGIRALWRVAQSGGETTTLATAADGTAVFDPQLLQGGRALLYTERTFQPAGQSADALVVRDLATGTSRRLLRGTRGRVLPTGHLVFFRGAQGGGALWAAAFDAARLEVKGDAVAVLEGIRVDGSPATTAVQLAVADTGAVAYVPAGVIGQQRALVWIDRQGREEPVGPPPRPYANPRVSSDGARLAITIREEGRDIWVWDAERRMLRQLTTDPSPNWVSAWFPDGKRLAFSAAVNGVTQIYEQAADASGTPRLLTERAFPSAISRDGRIMLLGVPTGLQWDIGVLPLANPAARQTLRSTPEIDRNPVLSPDGRWLAYESERSGRFEIWVRPFPDMEAAEYKVTTEGGVAPVWGPGGRELFYWTEDGPIVSIRAVPILPGATFDFGAPRQVVQGRFARPSWDTQYDVAPDGRLVLLKAAGPPPRDEIVTVLNWFEELNRLVPAR